MPASDKMKEASDKAKKAAEEEKERLEKAGHEAKAFTEKENEKVKEEFEKIGHHGSRGNAHPSGAWSSPLITLEAAISSCPGRNS